MVDLSGRRILLTGASGGIGGALARAMGRAGARIALSGTREEALRALATDIGDAVVLPCHLDRAEEVEQLVPRAVEALGGLDGLVNNAGVTRDGLLMRMKDEDWASVLRIDLEAAFRLARAAVRPMMKARFGRILSISSVVGSIGNPGQANYAAAKAGLEGMTRSIAAEVGGRGITANCIAPGFIRSAMTDALSETQRGKMLEHIPLGRFGAGEDVAAAALWLLSDGAGYVTGQTIHVNGGMYMA